MNTGPHTLTYSKQMLQLKPGSQTESVRLVTLPEGTKYTVAVGRSGQTIWTVVSQGEYHNQRFMSF